MVPSRSCVVARTWERGSGITLASGTGASAILVASVLTGRADRAATLELPGGELMIHWDERTNHVMMTGPAMETFSGTLSTSLLRKAGWKC
jgi:diaminopimelate epimerase